METDTPRKEQPGDGTSGPGIERTITLTDAVVAIAMTLLVLPLVEISGDVEADQLDAFVHEHGNLLLSFVISFLVVYVFWAAHGSAYRRMTGAGHDIAVLGPLNMLWLLCIAFLPFPTAVMGRELTTTSAPFYIGTLLLLSLLTSTITTVVHVHLRAPGRLWWAWLTTAIFAACAVISAFDAGLGLLALLALAVVRVVEVRVLHRRPARKAAATGAGDR